MNARFVAAVAAVLCMSGGAALADEQATFYGPLSPAEKQFVASVTKDLMSRYPHVADAEKAGYVRYTSPDDTGATSYADQQWNADPTHPSQLWYDRDGNLMGADFSVPRPSSESRPTVWGINPGRWYEFNGHVHYVIKDPSSSKMVYDQWIWNKDFQDAGGSLTKPSADTVVKLGRVPSANYISTIFEFPTQWDLIVWVTPHGDDPFHW